MNKQLLLLSLLLTFAHSGLAQSQTTATGGRTEIGVVALAGTWGRTDILGGVDGSYRLRRSGAVSLDIGGSLMREFPDQVDDSCPVAVASRSICDIRKVNRVILANMGLRLATRAEREWQFFVRVVPSVYVARIAENRMPTGDWASGFMVGGGVGFGRRIARHTVLLELQRALIPNTFEKRGRLFGLRVAVRP